MTSFLPPPSERPSLPKQSPPAQSAHAPLTAVAISTVHRSAHITPAGTLALLLYPASPRAALSQVAPVSRPLPTGYQLTTQHSLLRSHLRD
jgi:hypothetical protein